MQKAIVPVGEPATQSRTIIGLDLEETTIRLVIMDDDRR